MSNVTITDRTTDTTFSGAPEALPPGAGSPRPKLMRLYAFDLPAHQNWGGVWRANGVILDHSDSGNSYWKMVRVMVTDESQKLFEERTTLEVILTTYCKEVRFHTLENPTPHPETVD